MTRKERIKNMFRDGNEWREGIRNGLTIFQILDKLGIKRESTAEWREKKRRVASILNSVQNDLLKEEVFLFGLPFNKRGTRIYFIPATPEENERCRRYQNNMAIKARKKSRYELQKIRAAIRQDLITNLDLSELDKREIQSIIKESYDAMGE